MSHLQQRKDKNCLNCGTTVIGKYCHVCGQENTEPKESVWHLVSHFFSDITHFDGKFFASMKDIILKPGFLSKEYMIGRRASYLNPIRMYLFTSFIFFLIFFSLFKVDERVLSFKSNGTNIDKLDSAQLKALSEQLNNGVPLTKEELKNKLDTTSFSVAPGNYKSKSQYDSLLRSGAKKHNWFERMLVYKNIELNQKYAHNKRLALANLLAKVQHAIPQMLFILLPLFALVLKLLYIGHKRFYYADHAIFTIHFYIFVFMAMLLIFGVNKIETITGANWLVFINLAFILIIFFYLYKAMRNFYKQKRAKTILKYFLLLFSFMSIGTFIIIIFFFVSIFEI
ncbi:MAG: DUF3667 domain-containing protein [Ginsengibacter sp.]